MSGKNDAPWVLGDDLVTIRSKQPVDRSLERISAPSKVLWRLFVTLLIPILIFILGTFRVFVRRQTKQNYVKSQVSST